MACLTKDNLLNALSDSQPFKQRLAEIIERSGGLTGAQLTASLAKEGIPPSVAAMLGRASEGLMQVRGREILNARQALKDAFVEGIVPTIPKNRAPVHRQPNQLEMFTKTRVESRAVEIGRTGMSEEQFHGLNPREKGEHIVGRIANTTDIAGAGRVLKKFDIMSAPGEIPKVVDALRAKSKSDKAFRAAADRLAKAPKPMPFETKLVMTAEDLNALSPEGQLGYYRDLLAESSEAGTGLQAVQQGIADRIRLSAAAAVASVKNITSFVASPEVIHGNRAAIGDVRQFLARRKEGPSTLYDVIKAGKLLEERATTDFSRRFETLSLDLRKVKGADRLGWDIMNGDRPLEAAPDARSSQRLKMRSNFRAQLADLRTELDSIIQQAEPIVRERFNDHLQGLREELADLKDRRTGSFARHPARAAAETAVKKRIAHTEKKIETLNLHRENYITWAHAATIDDIIQTRGAFAGNPRVVSSEIWTPTVEQRLGTVPSTRSLTNSLQMYISYMHRLIHLEPAMRKAKPLVQELPKGSTSRIIAEGWWNRLKGNPHPQDIWVQDFLNKAGVAAKPSPLSRFAGGLNQRLYSGFLSILFTPLVNLTQPWILGLAELVGGGSGRTTIGKLAATPLQVARLTKGYGKTGRLLALKTWHRMRGKGTLFTELEDNNIIGQINQLFNEEFHNNLNTTFGKKKIRRMIDQMDRVSLSGMKLTEIADRGPVAFAGNDIALAAGASKADAAAYGTFVSNRTNFEFGVMGKPALLQTPVGKLMAPLTTFPLKSFEYLAVENLPKALSRQGAVSVAARAKLITYAAQVGILAAAGKALGFDAIDIAVISMLPMGLPVYLVFMSDLFDTGRAALKGNFKNAASKRLMRTIFRLSVPGGRSLTEENPLLGGKTIPEAAAGAVGAAIPQGAPPPPRDLGFSVQPAPTIQGQNPDTSLLTEEQRQNLRDLE